METSSSIPVSAGDARQKKRARPAKVDLKADLHACWHQCSLDSLTCMPPNKLQARMHSMPRVADLHRVVLNDMRNVLVAGCVGLAGASMTDRESSAFMHAHQNAITAASCNSWERPVNSCIPEVSRQQSII